jgi:hypothetical protein
MRRKETPSAHILILRQPYSLMQINKLQSSGKNAENARYIGVFCTFATGLFT